MKYILLTSIFVVLIACEKESSQSSKKKKNPAPKETAPVVIPNPIQTNLDRLEKLDINIEKQPIITSNNELIIVHKNEAKEFVLSKFDSNLKLMKTLELQTSKNVDFLHSNNEMLLIQIQSEKISRFELGHYILLMVNLNDLTLLSKMRLARDRNTLDENHVFGVRNGLVYVNHIEYDENNEGRLVSDFYDEKGNLVFSSNTFDQGEFHYQIILSDKSIINGKLEGISISNTTKEQRISNWSFKEKNCRIQYKDFLKIESEDSHFLTKFMYESEDGAIVVGVGSSSAIHEQDRVLYFKNSEAICKKDYVETKIPAKLKILADSYYRSDYRNGRPRMQFSNSTLILKTINDRDPEREGRIFLLNPSLGEIQNSFSPEGVYKKRIRDLRIELLSTSTNQNFIFLGPKLDSWKTEYFILDYSGNTIIQGKVGPHKEYYFLDQDRFFMIDETMYNKNEIQFVNLLENKVQSLIFERELYERRTYNYAYQRRLTTAFFGQGDNKSISMQIKPNITSFIFGNKFVVDKEIEFQSRYKPLIDSQGNMFLSSSERVVKVPSDYLNE